MSQYYDSVLRSTAPYFNVTTTLMLGSPKTWNVESIARSNLWDAKCNGTTTFTLGSRNT